MEKNMGKLQVTYEMIARLLMIDDRMKFVDVYTDPNRQIVHFIFESDQLVRSTTGHTYTVGEAQEVPTFSIQTEAYIEAMRDTVREWDEKEKKEQDNKLRKELKKLVMEVLSDVKLRGQER